MNTYPTPIQPAYQPQQPAAPWRQLASERMVTSAPMSFTGPALRIWRALDSNAALQWCLGLPLIGMVWMVILVWYIIFGIFVVPYRLIRRLQRKRKVADARHHEMLDQARREQRR